MSSPYRHADPIPPKPEPKIPFSERHPTLYKVLSKLGVFGVGLMATLVLLITLYGLGLASRYVGLVSEADTSPDIANGLVTLLLLILVVAVCFAIYLVGGLIYSKITGSDFDPF